MIAAAAWSDFEFTRSLENAFLRQSREASALIIDQTNITNSSSM